jgi:two-component system response regulator YesN
MRIVVVEDELRTRRSIIKLLTKLNPDYRVVGEAEDGAAGLTVIEQTAPDLVITDIKMPNIDGLEMIKTLKLRNADLRSKFLILSGYAEFEYAQQALKLGLVEYLLKPITVPELIASLQSIERMLAKEQEAAGMLAARSEPPEKLLGKIMMDQGNSPADIGKLAQHFEQVAAVRWSLGLIRFEPDVPEPEQEDWVAELTRLIGDDSWGELRPLLAANKPRRELALLFPQQAAGSGASFMGKLRSHCADHWSGEVVAGYAELDGLETIGRTYLWISANLKWNLVLEDIVFQEKVALLRPEQFTYPTEMEIKITQRIATLNFGELFDELEQFFGRLKARPFHPDDLREAVTRLTGAVLYAIQRERAEMNDQVKNTLIISRMDQCLWLGNKRKILEDLLRQVAGECSRKVSQYNLVIRKTLKIIEKEYHLDLSLEYLAGKLHITPEYLSALFARETGKNLIAYLTEYRIEKSKDLLLSRQYKIYEIAKMVGYSDVKYYCKVFKKITGHSAGDYLKLSC